jgi:UPF0755 protein
MNKKFKKTITVLFFSLIFIVIFSYINVQKIMNRPLDSSDTKLIPFEIKQGQSVKEIASNLEKGKLINGSDFFRFYLWENHLSSRLRAGTYNISPSMTIAKMVEIFSMGENGIKSNESKVILTEGSTNAEILVKLKEAGAISGNENFDDADIDLSKYDFLSDKPASSNLQGYLFPDTYNFFKGSPLKDITEKMLTNFDKKITDEMRNDIAAQNKKPL